MEKEELLNENRYQANKKKIAKIAVIVLIIGLAIGGILIEFGIKKLNDVNSKYGEIDEKYSEESKKKISEQLVNEKKVLENKKVELEAKGVKFNVVAKYTDGEEYELKLIVNILDPSFAYYKFEEYKNNPVTSKYCELMAKNDELNDENKLSYEKSRIDPMEAGSFFIFGGFVIFASCMIAGNIYMITKRREIMAFGVQQGMPVAQEGIEKMTPTMAKAGKTIMEEMAPMYGEIAKEVAKGVKEGIKEDNNNKHTI